MARSGSSSHRATHLQGLRSPSRSRDELARVRLCHARVLRGSLLLTYVIERVQAMSSSGIRRTWPLSVPTLPGIRPPASPPTPTGSSTRPRSTMSYLTRDGWPRDAQLLFSSGRNRGGHGPGPQHQAHDFAHHREFLGRHNAHVTLHSASGLAHLCACCWSGRASRRICMPTPSRTRSRVKPRPSRRGQSLRRKQSRCWAPMAADSSTPTALTRLRTPHRFRTSCRCSPSSSSLPDSPIRWAA